MTIWFVIAAVAWIVNVVSGVWMLRHRKQGMSWFRMIIDGGTWLRAGHFNPSVRLCRWVFFGSFAVFAAAALMQARHDPGGAP